MMRGMITKASNPMSMGVIKDNNGTEYFFHYSDFPKKNIKKGYVVEFEAFDEGKKKLKAINIKLISYGVNHPFCSPILNICKFIEENTPDTEDKEYRLRDLQMLYNYFAESENTDVKGLRIKYRPKKYTLNEGGEEE